MVHTAWRAHGVLPACEFSKPYPDWPSARQEALRHACLSGVRYITVQDPTGVVVGDWDWYTNRWRVYALHIGACDGEIGLDGEPCDGQLYAKPGEVQVRCPRCGGWSGYRARGMRQPFDVCGL